MNVPLRVLLAVVLASALTSPLHAQASDAAILARIAALEQEIATLKAQLHPALTAVYVSPSLAEASAAAAKITHEWATSTSTGTSTVMAVPPVDAAGSVKKDEAYWRGRLAPLRERIRATAQSALPIQARVIDLTIELSGIGALNARRGGVETERQRLITEVQVLEESMNADRRAVAAIEEEGRRAGAFPGWFR